MNTQTDVYDRYGSFIQYPKLAVAIGAPTREQALADAQARIAAGAQWAEIIGYSDSEGISPRVIAKLRGAQL